MSLMRWDIINHLIKKNNYTSYLEIGYFKGWSFDKVECFEKWAVDPSPSKDQDEADWPAGPMNLSRSSSFNDGSKGARFVLYKETSDQFFAEIPDRWKWDIIFIDGDHHSEQVDKDIQNALKHLNPGGTIVLHDCNPSSYEMTTTGTANGEWTGDVYKSFIRFRQTHSNYAYVVDTDYGVGIIKDVPYPNQIEQIWIPFIGDWEHFDKFRGPYLNLIPPSEFLTKEAIPEKV